jgi:MOSC domain-containing protein YiiM
MVARFVASGRSGFYVRVVREGDIASGDPIRLGERAAGSITVSEIFSLHFDDTGPHDGLRRAAAAPGLSPSWKESFLKRLERRRDE